MLEIKENSYKGTRILIGGDKRRIITSMAETLICAGYDEIQIPIIQFRETFKGKVGIENTSMMFGVKDNSDRDLVLAPEYTAVVQQLAKGYYKQQKDVKLFYVAECFRGEKPQRGRFRQFTQLGVEILNPSGNYSYAMISLAEELLRQAVSVLFETNTNITRGLDYYKGGKGFEISIPSLGSSKQICGGGEYDGGIGFAIGIDRLLTK